MQFASMYRADGANARVLRVPFDSALQSKRRVSLFSPALLSQWKCRSGPAWYPSSSLSKLLGAEEEEEEEARSGASGGGERQKEPSSLTHPHRIRRRHQKQDISPAQNEGQCRVAEGGGDARTDLSLSLCPFRSPSLSATLQRFAVKSALASIYSKLTQFFLPLSLARRANSREESEAERAPK